MIQVTIQNKFCLVEPQGPLSEADFKTIASQVDPVIEKEGELDGLVIKTRDFPGWEKFGDIVAHFRFIKNHHQKIKKVALVTDSKVADLAPVIVGHFVNAEVKHFDFDDFESAVEWVG
jgi:hypothetical protein